MSAAFPMDNGSHFQGDKFKLQKDNINAGVEFQGPRTDRDVCER